VLALNGSSARPSTVPWKVFPSVLVNVIMRMP
jgi:hypothetical protein